MAIENKTLSFHDESQTATSQLDLVVTTVPPGELWYIDDVAGYGMRSGSSDSPPIHFVYEQLANNAWHRMRHVEVGTVLSGTIFSNEVGFYVSGDVNDGARVRLYADTSAETLDIVTGAIMGRRLI